MRNLFPRIHWILLVAAAIFALASLATSCDDPLRSLGDNAALESLEVSGGSIDPEFAADHFEYTVTFPAGTTEATIEAVCADAAAVIEGTGIVAIADGESHTITITAEDGETTLAYTLSWVVEEEQIDPTGEPPAAPGTFAAEAAGPSSISLSWSDSDDSESGFTLQRKLSTTEWTAAVQVDLPENATAHEDDELSANTSYDYRLRAYNDAGPSEWVTASATTEESLDVDPIAENDTIGDATADEAGEGLLQINVDSMEAPEDYLTDGDTDWFWFLADTGSYYEVTAYSNGPSVSVAIYDGDQIELGGESSDTAVLVCEGADTYFAEFSFAGGDPGSYTLAASAYELQDRDEFYSVSDRDDAFFDSYDTSYVSTYSPSDGGTVTRYLEGSMDADLAYFTDGSSETPLTYTVTVDTSVPISVYIAVPGGMGGYITPMLYDPDSGEELGDILSDVEGRRSFDVTAEIDAEYVLVLESHERRYGDSVEFQISEAVDDSDPYEYYYDGSTPDDDFSDGAGSIEFVWNGGEPTSGSPIDATRRLTEGDVDYVAFYAQEGYLYTLWCSMSDSELPSFELYYWDEYESSLVFIEDDADTDNNNMHSGTPSYADGYIWNDEWNPNEWGSGTYVMKVYGDIGEYWIQAAQDGGVPIE